MPRPALLVSLSIALLWTLSQFAVAQQPASGAYQKEGRNKAFAKFVETPGAERLGSDQCRACHEEQGKSFRFSNHAQQSVECEDCHGSGSLHLTSDKHANIIKFGKVKAEQANGVCLWCHAQSGHVSNWSSSTHEAQESAALTVTSSTTEPVADKRPLLPAAARSEASAGPSSPAAN
jgi:hypothetical protein